MGKGAAGLKLDKAIESKELSAKMPTQQRSSGLEWLEVLGRGASGVCRKVQKDGVLLVVKQIDVSFITRDEFDNSMREAKLLSSLSHPNVIRFYEDYIEDDMLHIVMEYAPFGTLKQSLLKMSGLVEEAQAQWLFTNIMQGLAFLHERKVVHRDLKSENIFIGEGHIPKLGDFGVAKRLSSAQPMAVSVVGTPLYLSPELVNGQPYDMKSDIWAAGVILYEICSQGRSPFVAGNQGAVIKKILMGEYAPLSTIYSHGMKGVVSVCLQQNPNMRPTAEEVIWNLKGLKEPPGPNYESELRIPKGVDNDGMGFSTMFEEDEEQDPSPKGSNSQPLWWDWSENNGFVSGKFRTLFGGTPYASPGLQSRADNSYQRRQGPGGITPFARVSNQGMSRGSFVPGVSRGLPFGQRPTSAPSTPSTSGSPMNANARMLDFLLSTPAIQNGPLQGPMWWSPTNKMGSPLVPPQEHEGGEWDFDEESEHGQSRDRNRDEEPPLALTTVNDLTGWLEQYRGTWEQGGFEASNGSGLTRPTSSPDYSRGEGRRPMAVKPPTRVLGIRLGVNQPQDQANAAHNPNQPREGLQRDGAVRVYQPSNAHKENTKDLLSPPYARGRKLHLIPQPGHGIGHGTLLQAGLAMQGQGQGPSGPGPGKTSMGPAVNEDTGTGIPVHRKSGGKRGLQLEGHGFSQQVTRNPQKQNQRNSLESSKPPGISVRSVVGNTLALRAGRMAAEVPFHEELANRQVC
mmetsp:Transcript_24203/g.38023  ORF Transcript_24203/g.38023 Transcript_24203/m.38023 type:complete len:739 (+) Transcript_24203:74-2290(+)